MEQADLLRLAVEVLECQQVTYMLVGSLASGVYGEPRLTHDIDIVVDLRFDQVSLLCAAFPAPEFFVSLPAAYEAVNHGSQFSVIHPTSGEKIDFLLPRRDGWGRIQLARRRSEEVLPGRSGYTASPDDVILGKMWYYHEGGSEKHLRDIAAILQVSGELVDKEYVAHWAAQLGLTEIWHAVLRRLEKA